MKAKWKKKWLAALRSGNFEQGHGRLRDLKNRCCCLGVLADIGGAVWDKPYSGKYICDLSTSTGAVLHHGALKDFGLTGHQQDELCIMNDTGYSFDKIANWIERKL